VFSTNAPWASQGEKNATLTRQKEKKNQSNSDSKGKKPKAIEDIDNGWMKNTDLLNVGLPSQKKPQNPKA
jgi:hypothetical protein